MDAGESTKAFLAAWGALLSTGLGLLKLLEFQHGRNEQVEVAAVAEPPFESIRIEVCNAGDRPVTITSIAFSYGLRPLDNQNLLSSADGLPVKLEASDVWTRAIARSTLIAARQGNRVVQGPFWRVWVSVTTSRRRPFSRPLRINPSIIPRKYYLPAEPWIAADVLLGFEQLESDVKEHYLAHMSIK